MDGASPTSYTITPKFAGASFNAITSIAWDDGSSALYFIGTLPSTPNAYIFKLAAGSYGSGALTPTAVLISKLEVDTGSGTADPLIPLNTDQWSVLYDTEQSFA